MNDSFLRIFAPAANEAVLEQKKQNRLCAATPRSYVAIPASSAAAPAAATITKAAKRVKHLQASKQGVKHAVRLLSQGAANKEHQTLARKLFPQPESGLRAKAKKKGPQLYNSAWPKETNITT